MSNDKTCSLEDTLKHSSEPKKTDTALDLESVGQKAKVLSAVTDEIRARIFILLPREMRDCEVLVALELTRPYDFSSFG
jgi:hypothetical protein